MQEWGRQDRCRTEDKADWKEEFIDLNIINLVSQISPVRQEYCVTSNRERWGRELCWSICVMSLVSWDGWVGGWVKWRWMKGIKGEVKIEKEWKLEQEVWDGR